MPRRPRTELAGGIHHVWQRGNNRRPIFITPDDRRAFLRLLLESVRKYDWISLAYCLMENHFHLVVETPERNLGIGMRHLGSRYAQLFNELHETGGGHVFQARFGSRLVETDGQFAQLLRYVAFNPVKAGLCGSPADWAWSSHRLLLLGVDEPLVASSRVACLLEPFGGEAAARYPELFRAGGPLAEIPLSASPWDLRPTLQEILSVSDLAAALRRARRHGYRVSEVAAHLGISEITLWRNVKEKGPVPQ